MFKKALYSNEAREKMIAGAEKLAESVKATLGGKGRNAILINESGMPIITKDGVSVAQFFTDLECPYENAGASLLRDVASRTGIVAGDGTSTSVVLGMAIIKEAIKYIEKGVNPIDIKKGIDVALDFVLTELSKMSIDVSNSEDIKRIATVSTNGDDVLGQIIADAMELVGSDGLIEVDASNKIENELIKTDGMELETGYITPHFINTVKGNCELFDPIIFLYDSQVQRLQEVGNVLNIAIQANRPIVFICDDFTGEALSMFLQNIKDPNNNLKGCVIKAPSIGDRRIEIMKDIGVFTGGGLNSIVNGGFDISAVTPENIVAGSCDRIIIGKNTTTIINGDAVPEELEDRASVLESLIDEEVDVKTIDHLKKRLAKLTGGIAIIKLGASSQVELKEKIDRVDDALRSTRCGVEEGIVAGGGVALLNTSYVKFPKATTKAEKIGQDIMKKVMQYPFSKILDNAGLKPNKFMKKLKNLPDTVGYDVREDEIVDMIESGIIDPVKVTKTAITNAVSVAGLFITIECAIAPIKEDHDKQPPQQFMMPQMG